MDSINDPKAKSKSPSNSWRRWSSFALIGLAIGLLLSAARPMIPGLSRPGEVRAEPNVIEIGPSGQLESLQNLEVRLINQGDEPVRIESVTATCGCTKVSPLAGQIVPARGNLPLFATVNILSGSDRQVGILVRTTSSVNPEVTISIQLRGGKLANVSSFHRIPGLINLKGHHPGEIVEAEFDVVTLDPKHDSEPFLVGASSTLDNSTAEIIDVGAGEEFNQELIQRVCRIRISAKTPLFHDQTWFGRVNLETRKPLMGQKSIPFKVILAPSVRFVPDKMQFHVNDQTRYPLSATVLVRHDEGLELGNPQSDVDWLQVDLEADGVPQKSSLSVRKLLLLSHPQRGTSGSVVLLGGVNGQQSLALPVSVVHRGAVN